jgi:hypothetical protein
MNDQELIHYCRIHSDTERALFHRDHVKRILELAGITEPVIDATWPMFISVPSSQMEPICDEAQRKLDHLNQLELPL